MQGCEWKQTWHCERHVSHTRVKATERLKANLSSNSFEVQHIQHFSSTVSAYQMLKVHETKDPLNRKRRTHLGRDQNAPSLGLSWFQQCPDVAHFDKFPEDKVSSFTGKFHQAARDVEEHTLFAPLTMSSNIFLYSMTPQRNLEVGPELQSKVPIPILPWEA